MTRTVTGLQIGVSSVNITPPLPFDLAGMSEHQRAVKVHTPIQLRAFVFDTGIELAVLVTLDLLNIATETVGDIRAEVSRQFPNRPTTVLVACSHTHSAPYTTYFAGHAADRDYLAHVCQTAADVASTAYENRRTATVHQTAITAAGLSANRRAVLTDGQVATHAPTTAPDFSHFEGPVDTELVIAWFTDADGAIFGGLVNFACHPTLTGFDSCASADFPAQMRTSIEARYGGVFGFLQGASGDLSPAESFITYAAGTEAADDLGHQMATLACRAIEGARREANHQHLVELNWASRTLTISQRLATPDRVEAARRYLAGEISDCSPLPDTNRLLCGFNHTFYKSHPRVQQWFAHEMIGMWEWQQRATVATPTEQLEVQVLRVNGLLIVGLPCELFTQLGQEIKSAAGWATTMISTLTNGYHGYVPTLDAFEHGGYETRLSIQSRLEPNAGPRLVDAATGLITEVFSAPSS